MNNEILPAAPRGTLRWINDRLPRLENVHRLGISFDFILLNAVWMHVPSANRRRAFRKLVTLLLSLVRLAVWRSLEFVAGAAVR
jgi:hypothetical protein